ncbi:hypothetical protein D1815_21330 [Aquimarina sp. AD1]|uniref:hypothetical protein n=1 Tax=Aquimarina sp. (strain AD1) TaxID=1714848 RepID=UPI000E48DC1B|nr:hypothetical protein [Aquimarina sp. AD1]AXT58180.1 hypothetical protein D1815_21330 [Aquimarina sp. AD1]RKN24653.1 hypothetical protein D7035_11010 [Aquimarina sp. AD1]
MSELNSLFVKVKIKKNKLDDFLKSKPKQLKIDANWVAWWDSREMYGKNELSQDNLSSYEQPDNQSIVDTWKNNKRSGGFSEYDSENGIWNFGVVFFGENYYEMIPGLGFIKSIADYIEHDIGNFAIVFDFFWGSNEVNALIDFNKEKGCFKPTAKVKSDINPESLRYAEIYLNKKTEEFSKAHED